MRKLMLALLVSASSAAAWAAAATISKASAVPSTEQGGLFVSYTISSTMGTKCRHLGISFYPSRLAYESKANEELDAGALIWTTTNSEYTKNGTHTLVLDIDMVLGMSQDELVENYPEGVVIIELTDTCTSPFYPISLTTASAITDAIATGKNPAISSVDIAPTSPSTDGGVVDHSHSSGISINTQNLYKKSRVLSGIAFDENDGFYGMVSVKLGAKKRGTVKVSMTITPSVGKKLTVSKALDADDDGVIGGILPLKSPVGEVEIEIYPDDEGTVQFSAESDTFYMTGGSAGGKINAEQLAFGVEVGDIELPAGYELVVDPPEEAPIYVKSGAKWLFDKAPKVQYKKIDGEYELAGLDDDKKPNVSALKLSYNQKTGAFSGSFKIYTANENLSKPKLKTYTAKVQGMMIGTSGFGSATVKIGKTTYSWPVTIQNADE